MKQVFEIPERGDVVLLSLAFGAGRQTAARYPAVVMSPQAYNARVGLALFCPIVTEIKGYPFEVLLPAGLPVQGAILADQVECFDWRVLRAEPLGSLPASTVEEALGKLRALLA